MIQIKFRDIDPDSGIITLEKIVATCELAEIAKVIVKALNKEQADEPNREYFSIMSKESNSELNATLSQDDVLKKAMSTAPSPMPRNNGYTPYGSGDIKF